MPKNIVICCDGTGNEIDANLSNVLKLYRCLAKNENQIVYYDTGIGTITKSSPYRKLRIKWNSLIGQMTGLGLDLNVLQAYKFLSKNYEKGDHIYLFGFSRGAYTVRVLAGLIRMIGLLKFDQQNLFEYALTSYKKASAKNDREIGWRLNRVLEAEYVPIKFLGVWDTVSSVIVPKIYPTLQTLIYTSENDLVEVFRHALAIDERRRMFRADHWKEGQLFKRIPFMKDDNPHTKKQDCKQVWFSGVHSDVGGGYPETESEIAKYPLRWMMDEAKQHGLILKTQTYNHLANGKNKKGSNQNYVAPNPTGIIHKSLHTFWWLLEIFPKRTKRLEWITKWTLLGLYIPIAEPRLIDENANIHSSVLERIKQVNDYDPPNLPENFNIVP